MAEALLDQPAAAGAPPLSLLDRALGAYLGLAIGDALGATVEFMTPREIMSKYGTHREIIGGGWLRLKPGQVTDDTTMALALGDAIVSARGWDLTEVAEHYVGWLRSKPVDCGNTCRRGIRRYMQEGSLVAAFNEGDAGNGAVMRNLPVVLGFLNNEQALIDYSLAQGRITHGHPLSDLANVALARMTAALLRGEGMAVVQAIADELFTLEPRFSIQAYRGRATGYVVDTVQTVLYHFFNHEDFENSLIAVVNRGDDADTTGALVGMLAGARYGTRAFPRQWIRRIDPDVRHRIEVQTRQLLSLHTPIGGRS
ncbi:ADP-ribosyl-[dinitrogen reductase] hydrolase [Uliginosibacterium aquaticum]|uniref:ADP-ribosyl-[dinitrogen reductase] hydrolase n=1 Tax=Uliginosibacterium aquaticum TaxID=2731212 RepID=A0ABX2IK54_9RHOO|nr:ADP-ribosyl-[dinitrogen reductase] hydrolase [Uliginosibacterium aquaticum]NSL56867.1 ADP-ribosyl-[dinitrogen reductase] hydrolase [Uliginosibacterium aquaticum]